MANTMVVQVGKRGVLTLPKALRDHYKLQPGDLVTLLDLDGIFVLAPRRTQLDELAERITETLTSQGESLASMLQALREERERYGEAN